MSDFYNVECTAVPDGIHGVGAERMLRLSVVLRPDPAASAPPAGAEAISLANWTEIIPKLDFIVSFGSDVTSLAPIGPVQPEFDMPGLSEATKASVRQGAKLWWSSLWADQAVADAYRALMTTTAKSPLKVETYSYSLLAELAHARVASDITISALAGRKSKTLTTMKGLAAARRDDPNDAAIRVHDALSLLERDAFLELQSGDPVGDAVVRTARAGAKTLDQKFAEIHAAIDQEVAANGTQRLTKRSGVAWNPFLPVVKATQEDADTIAGDLFGNRFADDIFGVPVAKAGAAAVAGPPAESSPTEYGLEAYRRAFDRTRRPALKAPLSLAETAQAIAARHNAELQAHPALRKFVQLIIDIPIAPGLLPSAIRAAGRGVVAVSARAESGGWNYSVRPLATAFELDEAAGRFEPCPEWSYQSAKSFNPALAPSLPLDRGVVQLNIGREGEQGGEAKRFRIEVVNALAAMMAFERGLESTGHGIRKGLSPSEVTADEPSLRSRGLMLLDVEAIVPAHISAKRAAAGPPTPDPNAVPRLLYAEDLVDGYRLDVVAPKPIWAGDEFRRIFPTSERRLSYDVVAQAFGSAPGVNPYAAYAGRDDGYVVSPSQILETPPPDGSGAPAERYKLQSEVVCTWNGENVGLPSPDQPLRDRLPIELPMVSTYSYPVSLGPILREGGGYALMLRVRKINGSSISTKAAEGLLEHALGDGQGNAFPYTPVERTPAPIVLVPAGQTLISAAKEGDQPTAYAIQAIADAPQGPELRMLVLPEIGFDRAEQQGQFDPRAAVPGQVPDAAARQAAARRVMEGSYRRLRRQVAVPGPGPAVEGGFPDYPSDAGQAQALLFEVIDPSTQKARPYYVDNSLCVLGNRITPQGHTTALDLATVSADGLAFWKRVTGKPQEGFDPAGVTPIRLEVAGIKGTAQSRIAKAADRKIGPSGFEITVPVLRVEVGPADSLELELWTNRLDNALQRHPAWRRSLARLTKLDLPTDRRVPALHEVVRVRITHPVAVPLAKPGFELLGAVRCNGSQWKDGKGLLRESQRDANASYAWGRISIDRKSTGMVWADCRWSESDPVSQLHRTARPADDHAIDQPETLYSYEETILKGRLFTIADIAALSPLDGETRQAFRTRANSLDLARDEHGALRNLTADFRSDRARRLIVRLVARSRFAPPSTDPEDFSHSTVSTEDMVFEDYVRKGGPLPAGTADFWLPATRPPAVPVLMGVTGTLYHRRFDDATNLPAKHRGKTLTHVYRCWLDDRWFDSGPHEKLAIVCRASSTTAPDWIKPLLSRWGADMTMAPGRPLGRSGELASYLQPEQFVLDDKLDVGPGTPSIPSILRNVPLPAPVPDDQQPPSLVAHNVDIALITPSFHKGAGRWYCDIELKGEPAFRVNLQLSLSRYQYHAIKGCNLSKPVRANAFMLHQPWTFSAVRTGNLVEISALGPSYIERAPMIADLLSPTSSSVSQAAAAPLVTVELERLADGGTLPVVGPDGRTVMTTSRSSTSKAQTSGQAIPTGWTRWTMALTIPSDPIYEDGLAVRVTLASAHANAQAADADVADGALIYLPEPLVVQLTLDN